MDTEKGEAQTPRMTKYEKLKSSPFFVKVLVACVFIMCVILLMFGMGILGALYAQTKIFKDDHHLLDAAAEHHASDEGPKIARHLEGAGGSYPISTKTALSTIYGVSYTSNPEVVTEVLTVPGTTYVTVPGEAQVSVSVTTRESTAEYCEIEVVTITASYTITIPNDKASQDSSGEAVGATVTGSPQTVTETRTDISLTDGPSDAIVTGNPQTVTETQIDISLTGGPSEVVTTSHPQAITNTFEISSFPPKPHTTITVQSLYPPLKDLSTVTQYTTIEKTITAPKSFITVTLTSHCPECTPIEPASPTSSTTTTVYETAGEPSTSTTTIIVPPPAYPPNPPYPTSNNTLPPSPSGSITVVPSPPTTPVIVSGGTKKPEPRGWGGTSGTTNLSCTVMLVAIIMFTL
ncbi:hypothetical protein IL306_014580 [Fusarium sp. DS 682]|nr:hypothetical protein IL306_014580 [Fusarium sp. DS 682]